MKKRLLAVLLATSMLTVSVTGCGSQETSGEEETIEKDADEEDEEEDKDEEDEKESEEESKEEATPEPTEAPTPEPTEAPTPEPTEAPVDWSTMYDDYFDREDIMYEKCMVSGELTEDGITMNIAVAFADDMKYMYIDFKDVASLNLYMNDEKMYCGAKAGDEEVWNWAPMDDTVDMDSIVDTTEFYDTSSITESKYKEEVTEDGVVYDVLSYTSEEKDEYEELQTKEGECYINRETQKVDRVVSFEEGTEVVMKVEEIDSIELPAEALTATETTSEEIAGTILGVIMIGAMSGMEDIEPTKEPAEPTKEPAEPTEEPEEPNGQGSDDSDDWAEAYNDYFERDNIMPKNCETEMLATIDDMDVEITLAVADNDARMYFDLETVMMDLYVIDKKIYLKGTAEGEDIWMWTEAESEEDTEGLVDTESVSIIDTDTIVSYEYREAVEEDGVVYDVLDVVTKDDSSELEWAYFINRETQYLEKAVAIDNDGTVLCNIREIEEIELPEDADEAEETDVETIAMSMFALLMLVTEANQALVE